MKYLLLIMVACLYQFAHSEYRESEDNYNYITFTMDSYRKVGASLTHNNFVYSPLSLNVIYNILYQSANGQSELDLRKILLPYSNQNVTKHNILTRQMDALAQIAENPKIKLANKFYVDDSVEFDKDFQNIAQHYQSTVENINFKNNEHAVSTMNNWVENRTHGMITNLISPRNIDDSTEMVIINTIYFKDEWQSQFGEHQVREGTFYTAQNGPVQTKFLEDTSRYFVAYRPNLGLFALRVPYKNGFEFWILLPMVNYTLDNLIQNINADYIKDIKNNFVHKKVEMKFPTFTIENYLDCTSPSPGAFGNNNFKIIDGERRKIGVVIQKAKIIVNREGTEAAAATYATAVGSIRPPPETPFIFEADRPFMYVIIAPNSLRPIFIGHFTTPTP